MTATQPSGARARWRAPARISQLAAVGLSAAAGAIVLLAPLYTHDIETVTSSGVTVSHEQARLAESLGNGVYAVVAIPLLLTVIPLVSTERSHRTITLVAAGLLGVLCALALLSIGFLYVPAAIALVVSAVLAGKAPAESAPSLKSTETTQ